MKNLKYILALLLFAPLGACDKDIYEPIEFDVSLDEANTYKIGEAVTFNFSGNADYMIFYSGEIGSEYKYKDRTEVAMEDLETCRLTMKVQARYGLPNSLKYYVAPTFTGLKGNDAEQDYQTMQAVIASNYEGWTQLDYQEGASTVWTEQEYDITQYADGFALAYNWNPPSFTSSQRSYWINPEIKVKFKGYDEVTISEDDMQFTALSMADEDAANRYKINNGNGSVVFNNSPTANIIMQGVGANALNYALNYWVISKPRKLNSISPDKGLNIKSLIDDLETYSYSYDKAGEYTVSFVATSADIYGSSRKVKELSFTIIDDTPTQASANGVEYEANTIEKN